MPKSRFKLERALELVGQALELAQMAGAAGGTVAELQRAKVVLAQEVASLPKNEGEIS